MKGWRLSLGLATLVCVAVLVPVSPTSATEDAASVQIGGVVLRLGMPKALVLERLRVSYIVAGSDLPPDAWTVSQKQADGLFASLGVVQFTEGKLTTISKNWVHSTDPAAFEAVSELFSALLNLNQNGALPGLLSTSRLRQPSVRVDTIEIRFGQKVLSVYVTEQSSSGQRIRQIEIHEDLRGF